MNITKRDNSFQTGVYDIVFCLSQCRATPHCHSVNYETGLCVLFNSSYSGNYKSISNLDRYKYR